MPTKQNIAIYLSSVDETCFIKAKNSKFLSVLEVCAPKISLANELRFLHSLLNFERYYQYS